MIDFHNKLLVAMPSLQNDSIFANAVIYIFQDDMLGSLGIILNKSMSVTLDNIFDSSGITHTLPNQKDMSRKILFGGPLKPEHGLILHSNKIKPFRNTNPITKTLSLTTSKDFLESTVDMQTNSKWLVALGHCSWEKGQLINELKQNNWLVIDSSDDFLFNTPSHKMYNKALSLIGINNPESVLAQYGHA